MTDGTGDLVRAVDLAKHYDVGDSLWSRKTLRAVDGVSFSIPPGGTLGLVGESGCGKSTVARLLLCLVKATRGSVMFDGVELTTQRRAALQHLRRRMQIVFQDPNSSLDPRMRIRSTLAEPLRLHLGLSGRALTERMNELMELVGLNAQQLNRYPHQLSGGQRQRVGIARAISTNPDFVVLDEPTSSLDVSVQGQILRLLQRLQADLGLTYLIISHDLSVIRHMAQRVAVMYLGAIVEMGPVAEIFRDPKHPYTRALLSAVPTVRPLRHEAPVQLSGEIPSPTDLPTACRLAPRCPLVHEPCWVKEPALLPVARDHHAACYAVEPLEAAETSSPAGGSG